MDRLFDLPETPQAAETAAGTAEDPQRLRTTAGFEVVDDDPVVRVHVLGVLPHLDRPFEYAVTPETAEAGPGMRVKVSFTGKDHDGIVIERSQTAQTDRPLAPLKRLLSTDVVLTPAMATVCARVAAHYGGTTADVIRLAVPARHARAEELENAADYGTEARGRGETSGAQPPTGGIFDRYAGLRAFINRAGTVPVPRAGIVLNPRDSWTEVTARAIAELPPGQGALVVAPDARDLDRMAAALAKLGITPEVLTSSDGPQRRYRAFLRILRGHSRIVIGTRSAAFAPVHDLALVVCWDPADDLLVDQRSPYPHASHVLRERSQIENAALLLLSNSDTVTMRDLSTHADVRMLEPIRESSAEARAHVRAMDSYLREREGASGQSRLPREAMRVINRGLEHGPVLVQVPRSGYVPAMACAFCGTRATCSTCGSVLSMPRWRDALHCRLCGRREDAYRCPECHRSDLKALVTGSSRTAEELSRAFPATAIRVAGGPAGPLADADVPDHGLVIATPGAEPWPAGRYAAAVLLDADAMLGRAAFDADVEAVRRWANAIAMVRTAEHGGEVLIVGTATVPAIRSLVAHRSRAFLDQVLSEREQLHLPPFTRVAEVAGDARAVHMLVDSLELPDGAEVFGPLPYEPLPTAASSSSGDDHAGALLSEHHRPTHRAVVRVPSARGEELAAAVRTAIAGRTARKDPGQVRVQLDPPTVF